jgi:hypothetical protein
MYSNAVLYVCYATMDKVQYNVVHENMPIVRCHVFTPVCSDVHDIQGEYVYITSEYVVLLYVRYDSECA